MWVDGADLPRGKPTRRRRSGADPFGAVGERRGHAEPASVRLATRGGPDHSAGGPAQSKTLARAREPEAGERSGWAPETRLFLRFSFWRSRPLMVECKRGMIQRCCAGTPLSFRPSLWDSIRIRGANPQINLRAIFNCSFGTKEPTTGPPPKLRCAQGSRQPAV